MAAVLLSILSFLGRHALSAAKMLGIQIKTIFARLLLKAKTAAAIIFALTSARVAVYAAIVVAFEAGLTGLAFLVLSPLSASLLRVLLPNSSWAEGLFYMTWDEGICLSFVWSLTIVYWGNVFAVRRVIDIFSHALTYRIMVHGNYRGISLGLLAGR